MEMNRPASSIEPVSSNEIIPENGFSVSRDQPVESLQNFYDFFNTINDFLFILDMDGNIVHFNKTVESRLKFTSEELIGQSVLMVHPEPRRAEANQYVGEMLQKKREFCPVPLITKQGQQIPVETRVTLGTWSGQPVLFGVSKDITDLKLSEEKFSKAFQNSSSIMAISRINNGEYIDVNQAFCDTLGYTREEIIGNSSLGLNMFLNTQDRADMILKLESTAKIRNFELVVRAKNNELLIGQFNAEYIYIGQEKCLITTMIDITENRKMEKEIRNYTNELEQQVEKKVAEILEAEYSLRENELKQQEALNYINLHDPLTGLLNRNALRMFKIKVQNDDQENLSRTVLCVNIDNFRVINDVLGHNTGDQFIIEFSEKLLSFTKEMGTVYRNDGDEFVILIDSNDSETVHKLAKKLLQAMSEKVMINNQLFFLTASIGICIGKPKQSIDLTIRNADTALYIAKKSKNTFVIFTQEMEKTHSREAILEEDLRRAIEKGELELHFQPIYNIKSKQFDQAEALLRWNHPEFGRVSPAEFIPIAEKTKLILPITDWVIHEACQKIALWKDMGIQGVMISINLSFISFENRGDELTRFIEKTILEAAIDPECLKLEITESTLIHDTEDVIKAFQELKRIGVKLALDDFGTGYSTFGYLKDLPLDIVKIDSSLIADLETNPKEQMIIISLITIIHGLGLEVVVEGVERKAQLDLLAQYGSDYIQGYYFSRPLPAADYIAFYFNSLK